MIYNNIVKAIHKYGFKNLIIYLGTIFLTSTVFLSYNKIGEPIITKNKAAETTNTTYWQEITTKNISVNNSIVNKLTVQNTADFINISAPVTTGVWEGMKVSVIKNEMLPEIYNSNSIGVDAIEEMADGRLFFGGLNVLSIKDKDDLNWENFQTYELSPPSSAIIDSRFIIQTNTNPYDVYFGSTLSTVKMKTDNTFELLADPTDIRGYLRDARVVPYSNKQGVVAYKSTELYYYEADQMRKWSTPTRPYCNVQDSIIGMFTDKENNKTYAIIQEKFTTLSCQSLFEYRLYEINLSIDPNIPLTAIRLGKIIPSQYPWSTGTTLDEQMVVIRDKNNPSIKSLFIGANGYLLSIIPELKFEESGVMEVKQFKIYALDNNWMNSASGFAYEKNNEGLDNLWFTSQEVYGLYKGQISDLNNIYSGQFYRTSDMTIVANSYINDVAVDSKGTVYTAHKRLFGNQANNALITIFEPIEITSTPTLTITQTPTITLTPTPTKTRTPTPTKTKTPTPTQPPSPGCNQICSATNPCESDGPGPAYLICHPLGFVSRCRNFRCLNDSDCNCAVTTNTPTPTSIVKCGRIDQTCCTIKPRCRQNGLVCISGFCRYGYD